MSALPAYLSWIQMWVAWHHTSSLLEASQEAELNDTSGFLSNPNVELQDDIILF